MRWATAKAEGNVNETQRAAVDTALRRLAVSAQWRTSERAQRTYALLSCSDAAVDIADVRAAAAMCEAAVYDAPVIALAVYPSVAEALPYLREAFDRPGRPAGVRACEPCGDNGVALEWDVMQTPASLVLALVDTELARFHAGRINELLTPLPPEWAARIAADGLCTPEISPDRTLETLLARAGLTGE